MPVLSVRNSTNPSETYRTLIHRHIDFSVPVFPQAVPVRSHTCHPAVLPDTPACSPPPLNIFRFQEQTSAKKLRRQKPFSFFPPGKSRRPDGTRQQKCRQGFRRPGRRRLAMPARIRSSRMPPQESPTERPLRQDTKAVLSHTSPFNPFR